jgi:hypothetical protein
MRYAVRFGLLLLVAVTACEKSPTKPPPPSPPPPQGARVAVGDTITGSLHGDSIPTYSFLAQSGAEYAVFLEVIQGFGILTVSDSLSHEQVASITDVQGGPGIISVATASFSRTGVLLLSVRGPGVAFDTTRFRFTIFQINRAPELRPARFAIGDTVTEDLDPGVDVDDFVAAGQAGQEFVGWMERLRPFSGSLNMLVQDPTTSTTLGVVTNLEADTLVRLFRTAPLPRTQDYGFTVPAVRVPGATQYIGGYRFRFYPLHRPPETISASLATDTVITGETIDIPGDIDEFRFTAASGEEFNAFIQSTAARTMSVVPFGDIEGGSEAGTVAADTGIYQHGTGRFKVVTAGGHGIRVQSENLMDATGAYRLYLYRINRAPELVSSTIVFGDTISGETIKLPGDIDEFTFSGTAGQEFNVFLQATNPTPPLGVVLSVVDPNNTLLAGTQSLVAGTPFLALSTGRFALPVSGTYRVWVDGSVGPYRLMVYRVNPKPESVSDTLVFGDSVSTEAIDVPGDVDEYQVVVAESSLANLVLQLEPGANPGAVNASLLKSGSRQEVVAVVGTSTPGVLGQSGRFAVGPGSYVLRVENPLGPSPAAAAYIVKLYRFKASPENVSETIVVGDTIETESIEPPGDLDRYYLDGHAGEHINIAIQGTAAPPSSGGFRALLNYPGGLFPLALVATPTSSASLDDRQTLRFDLPVTGRYLLDVTAGSTPGLLTEHGSYRLAVTHTSTAPEQTSAALVPGDSVTAEPLDPIGDWDQFTVTATAGQDLGLIFQSTATTYYPRILAFNPVTGDTLAGTVGQFVRFAGPFRVPSGGSVAVAVFEPPIRQGTRECYDGACGGIYGFTGGYKFHVITVNRAPEAVPAAYAVDDTVRGEAIAPVGDVDEFTATAAAGASLTLFCRLTANRVGNTGISFEVIDPATGAIVGGQGNQLVGTTQQFISFGSFTVPASGTFLVRVRGSGTFGDEVATAPYEFFVKSGP